MSDELFDPQRPHLGGAYPQGDSNTIMPDVWGYLIVKYQPRSFLDVGCGFGYAMEWFSKNLVHVRGIDGWRRAIRENRVPGHAIEHDFTRGPHWLGENYDLCWSAEFLEHVEARYLPNVMQAFRWCRNVVITHAEPGQDGYHHVNCQDNSYWIKVFEEWGFHHDAEETALLRATDRWKAGWGRRTLMSFRRNWP